ncbi:MAG: hypothetical protein WKG07_06380 [Hymenobacter sp.]
MRPIAPGMVAAGSAFVELPLARYARGAQLSVMVSNPQTGQVLRRLPLAARPGAGRLYAQPWHDAGLRQVAVAITCYPPRGAPHTDRLLLPLTGPE